MQSSLTNFYVLITQKQQVQEAGL